MWRFSAPISSRSPESQEKPLALEASHAPSPPTATSTSPIPFTNHRFLSKKGNCLKLKLSKSIIDFGGCGKKMEEGWGWDMLMKIIWVITSWKRWPIPRALWEVRGLGEGIPVGPPPHRAPWEFHLALGTPLCKVTQGPAQACAPWIQKGPERS